MPRDYETRTKNGQPQVWIPGAGWQPPVTTAPPPPAVPPPGSPGNPFPEQFPFPGDGGGTPEFPGFPGDPGDGGGSGSGGGPGLPLDPLLLEMGFTTAEEQQQALAWMMANGWTYADLANSSGGFAGGGGGGGGGGFGGGGGGGRPAPPPPVKFEEFDLEVAGAADWWKALKPDRLTPISEFQTLANLWLPFMSPEDARTVSTTLFQSDPEAFAHLDPEVLKLSIPSSIDPSSTAAFMSGERASNALTALTGLTAALGKEDDELGPGFNFLRGLAAAVERFGGAGGLLPTRQERTQLRAELDPLIAQTEGQQLGAFGPLARGFTQPFFSAGLLDPRRRNRANQSVFGSPNPALF